MLAGAEAGPARMPIKSPKAHGTKTRGTTMKNFLDALLAVLAGNAIYYLPMPHLPGVARHRLFKEDWGLLVDFLVCTAIFAAAKYARWKDER
jgi:hypothetical protein